MRISPEGIKQIARREGTVLHVYKDSKGLPTAGVGHLLTLDEKKDFPVGTKITQAQSDAWLIADLKEAQAAVNSSITKSLTQNEFDALVSLTFNIGVAGFKRSSVVRKLNAGDKKGAAEAILLWNKPPEIQGRRRTEYFQFKTPYKDSAQDSQLPANKVSKLQDDGKPSDTPAPTPDPVTETKTKQTLEQEGQTVSAEVTTTTPAGDAPDVPPTKVTKNSLISQLLAGVGGVGGLVTAAWGFATGNASALSVGFICVTVLILVIIDRFTKTDVERMRSAADPDKKNVT